MKEVWKCDLNIYHEMLHLFEIFIYLKLHIKGRGELVLQIKLPRMEGVYSSRVWFLSCLSLKCSFKIL